MGEGETLPSPFMENMPNFFSPSFVSVAVVAEEVEAELSEGGECSLMNARPNGCVLLKFCVTTILTRDLVEEETGIGGRREGGEGEKKHVFA